MKIAKSVFNKVVSAIRFDEKKLTLSERVQFDVGSPEYYETQATILIQEAAQLRRTKQKPPYYSSTILKAIRLLILAVVYGDAAENVSLNEKRTRSKGAGSNRKDADPVGVASNDDARERVSKGVS